MSRRYHVVAVNARSGEVTCCTRTPVAHKEACEIKRRFSYHPMRHIRLMDTYEWSKHQLAL